MLFVWLMISPPYCALLLGVVFIVCFQLFRGLMKGILIVWFHPPFYMSDINRMVIWTIYFADSWNIDKMSTEQNQSINSEPNKKWNDQYINRRINDLMLAHEKNSTFISSNEKCFDIVCYFIVFIIISLAISHKFRQSCKRKILIPFY